MKRKSLGFIAGLMLLSNSAFGEYECTGIKDIIRIDFPFGTADIQGMYIDSDKDGRPDRFELYIIDGCYRKLRTSNFGDETQMEMINNDRLAVNKYINWKSKKNE